MVKRNRLIKAAAAILAVPAALAVYITVSTTRVDAQAYRANGWNYTKHDKTILNWKEAQVSTVHMDSVKYRSLSAEGWRPFISINRALLKLNGNTAVYVCFHTKYDAMLGPIGLYYNPITKCVIGYDARE